MNHGGKKKLLSINVASEKVIKFYQNLDANSSKDED